MARSAYTETLLGGLPVEIRRAFRAVFDYILTSLRIGRATAGTRAENMQWYFIQGTTPSTPNEIFSLEHKLGVAPYLVMQVLPVDSAGGQFVRLGVTQAADASRVYLCSPETDAPITLLVEG
jgi:hypothetical protein